MSTDQQCRNAATMSSVDAVVAAETDATENVPQEDEEEAASQRQPSLEITVVTPNGIKILVSAVPASEHTSYIRVILQEFEETAPFTNYEFELDGTVINDYIEIGHYAPPEGEMLLLTMKPVCYDIKKSRLQLKRVRDMIAYPPTAKGSAPHIPHTNVTANAEQVVNKKETTPTAASLRSKIPKADEIFAPATLESFFTRTMLQAGVSTDGSAVPVKIPSECVKSLSASGWNPPPPYRRSQGDLFYIEAVTEEAVFHITCTPAGFYVNKSTRYLFDPAPTANAHFSHELFLTLWGASASLRTSWHAFTTAAKVSPKSLEQSTGALDVVSALYAQGREAQIFLRPQWTVPPLGTLSKQNSSGVDGNVPLKGLKHSFDLSRLHDDLGNQFGAEEPGAPREW